MTHFSGVEQQNRGFKKLAWVGLVAIACVLGVFALQAMGLIPLSIF